MMRKPADGCAGERGAASRAGAPEPGRKRKEGACAPDQAAQLLQQAGYAANDVGNALKSAYNASAEVAAKALKGAGYAVNEVGDVMKSAYGVASDQVNKVLQGAGFAANEVNKFFGKAGDAVVDTAKKAGEKLDPTKW
jgi:ElaB/YqjD/DUF883 family membrane-anchored ribosome-binding protein